MKRFYSFIAFAMLVASFSMTATAQHYVKVVKDTESVNGNKYSKGNVLSVEIDSAQSCCIKIIQQANPQFARNGKNLHRGGVVDNKIFKITKLDTEIKNVEFEDDNNETRSNCFNKAQILVQVGEDYLAYNDIDFLDAADVKNNTDEVKKEILEACTYQHGTQELDFSKCAYQYKYKTYTGKEPKQYAVSPDAVITFLTNEKDIPNIELKAKEFKEPEQTKKPEDNLWTKFVNVFKERWILWTIIVAVVVIGIGAITLLSVLKKRKSSDDGMERNQKNHKQHHKENAQCKEQKSNDVCSPINNPINDKLLQKVDIVSTQVTTNQTKLERLETTLKEIKQLVSNTDEKKLLDQKNKELEAEKKKLSDAIAEKKTLVAEKDAANQRIGELQAEIKSLKAGSSIEGAVQINDYSAFVTFAQKIMQECMKVEGIVVKYLNSLKEKDSQILVPFILKFQAEKDNEKLARWNGIIATLDLKGYVKDEEYVSYLAKESDKVGFLEKRFFQDILRPYVGAVILLLEQIRTAPQIKVSVACNENIEGYINSICTKCADRGVTIDYKKLYEKVTDFESLEIEDNVPNVIKKHTAHIEGEEILLYVDRYAVNLKTGELAEKTRCYIKI